VTCINLLKIWDLHSSGCGALVSAMQQDGKQSKVWGFLDSNLIRTFLWYLMGLRFSVLSHVRSHMYMRWFHPPCLYGIQILLTEDELSGYGLLLLLLFSTYALQPSRLILRSGLDVPTFATRCLHACHHTRAPSGEGGTVGEKCPGIFPKCWLTRYI
jgi:hypothetical protein